MRAEASNFEMSWDWKSDDLAERMFLSTSSAGQAAYQAAMQAATASLIRFASQGSSPYSGLSPGHVAGKLQSMDLCPEDGTPLEAVLSDIEQTVLAHSVVVSHPHCIAHLHCPPLIPALAAELLVSATNQSMDSWDQSPAATPIEQLVVRWLGGEFGFGRECDGIFTSGGTLSNLMGLMLAREHYARERLGWNVQQCGLPPDAVRWRIVTSAAAHFTIRQAAALLGLGEEAVVAIPTDEAYRVDLRALEARLTLLRRADLLPIALVATAGTTDTGSIDPLPEMASLAARERLWFHVDAAYGGAVILSPRYRPFLAGIQAADSIAVDFHKLLYQPISCGAFLVKDARCFELMRRHADYLNPREDESEGVQNLVTKSVQTTRRFDALKVLVCLRTLGRKSLAELIQRPIDLATRVAALISEDPSFELAHRPMLSALLFRYRTAAAIGSPPNSPSGEVRINRVNRLIRRKLREEGTAMLAETKQSGKTYLKMTLINPRTTLSHLAAILLRIKELGATLEAEKEEPHGCTSYERRSDHC
jgi:L-2,4-diaminobutyrate decarboxylase